MRRLTLKGAQSIRELIRASVRTSDEQRFLHRLHCVLLVGEGRSCYEVARWFGEHPRTVERWVRALAAHGVEALREHHAGGRPAKLAAGEARRLALELQKPPHASGCSERHWSGMVLTQHLAASYGIKLSARQCQRLLRQLGTAREAAL